MYLKCSTKTIYPSQVNQLSCLPNRYITPMILGCGSQKVIGQHSTKSIRLFAPQDPITRRSWSVLVIAVPFSALLNKQVLHAQMLVLWPRKLYLSHLCYICYSVSFISCFGHFCLASIATNIHFFVSQLSKTCK